MALARVPSNSEWSNSAVRLGGRGNKTNQLLIISPSRVMAMTNRPSPKRSCHTSWGKVHEDTNMQSFEKLLQDLNLICYLLSRVVYHLLLSSFLFF